VTGQKSPSRLQPGEYQVDEAVNALTMVFLPGTHPHTLIGLTAEGRVLTVIVPGQTHFAGARLAELAEQLIRQGARDVLLWANGKDAFQWNADQTVIGADNARGKWLEAIIISLPKNDAAAEPNPRDIGLELLKDSQRNRAARQNVSAALTPGNRLLLGVAEWFPECIRTAVHILVRHAQPLDYLLWVLSDEAMPLSSPLSQQVLATNTRVRSTYLRLARTDPFDRKAMTRAQLEFSFCLIHYLNAHSEFTPEQRAENLLFFKEFILRMNSIKTVPIAAAIRAKGSRDAFKVPAVLFTPGYAGALKRIALWVERDSRFIINNEVIRKLIRKGRPSSVRRAV